MTTGSVQFLLSTRALWSAPQGPRPVPSAPEPWLRRPTRASGFQVRSDRDKFVIFLDVKHFSPEDLTVKVLEDFVEIHGKHNERQVRDGRPPGPFSW